VHNLLSIGNGQDSIRPSARVRPIFQLLEKWAQRFKRTVEFWDEWVDPRLICLASVRRWPHDGSQLLLRTIELESTEYVYLLLAVRVMVVVCIYI
jgi:hypothetical protein